MSVFRIHLDRVQHRDTSFSWSVQPIWLAILAVTTSLLLATPANAGVPDWIQQDITRCQQTVSGIRFWAWINLAIAIAVGFLGLLVSTAQSDSLRWKRLVVAAGLAVSALTIVREQFFQRTTHHALFDRCDEGERLLGKIRRQVGQNQSLPEEDPAWKGLVAVVDEHLTRCESLNEAIDNPTKFSWLLPDTAFAAILNENVSSAPAWLTSRPESENRLYFVGVAHGQDLTTDKTEALQNGRSQIEDYVLGISGSQDARRSDTEWIAGVARSVAAGAGIVDSYVSFDSESGLASYFVLLALDKRQARRAILLERTTGTKTQADQLAVALSNAQGPSNAYESRRQEAYACFLDKARSALTADQYTQLIGAREARKQADVNRTQGYQTIIDQLQQLASRVPDCYLCWFNLGIAFERSNQPAKALEAYERATKIEPGLGCKDASIYSMYGRLLTLEGMYSQAVPVLEKALQIEPEHLYAPRFLEIAKQRRG